MDYIIFGVVILYLRVGCGWFITVRVYFLLLIVVSNFVPDDSWNIVRSGCGAAGKGIMLRAWCSCFGAFFGIVVRIDTVLSFMYDMFVRRMGLFDHGYGLRLLELGSCPYRYCFKLHV